MAEVKGEQGAGCARAQAHALRIKAQSRPGEVDSYTFLSYKGSQGRIPAKTGAASAC